MFLLGRALELALKAHLLVTGAPAERLRHRDVRHDLAELLRRCKTAGLSCEQETEQLIGRFSTVHADDVARYRTN